MRNSCSMVWSVARTTRPIAARAATPPSSSDGTTPRSIGPDSAGAAAVSMSDMDAAPWLPGQKTVHGYCRVAPGDQVRRDSGRAVRHRPSDVAMSCVEEKVPEAPPPEERKIVGRHRSQARPHLRAVVVRAVGVKVLGDSLHESEIGRLVARVVTGELGGRSDANSIPEAGDGDEIVLVDGSNRRRRQPVADRYRKRIALDRIDRQLNTELARENRALGSKGENKGVALEGASVSQ